MFYALAIVCDDFFVPSLEKICEVRGRDSGSLGEVSEGTGGIEDTWHVSARPRTAGEHSGGEDNQVKHLASPHQTLTPKPPDQSWWVASSPRLGRRNWFTEGCRDN